MTLDHQFDTFKRTRANLSLAVAPLQYVVDKPVVFARWLETNFTTQQSLLMENAQLRARQLLLYAKLQKVLALERENAQLRALLKSSSHFEDKVNVAQLLAVDLAPYTQQIIVDKGKNEGVYIGQPVLDAYGVMGQVIAVGPITSRVLLVTDSRSAIPVQNNRNGNRAILVGLGYDGVLELSNVPITVDFQKNDILVTSGLDGLYPPGYPIGKVTTVKRMPGERFASISVLPSAHVNQSRQVLLVWPKLDKNFTPKDSNAATESKKSSAKADESKEPENEVEEKPKPKPTRPRRRRHRYFNDGYMGIE